MLQGYKQTMMLLKRRSDLLSFILYSMNVLMNFSVNFHLKIKNWTFLICPLNELFKNLMNLIFRRKGSCQIDKIQSGNSFLRHPVYCTIFLLYYTVLYYSITILYIAIDERQINPVLALLCLNISSLATLIQEGYIRISDRKILITAPLPTI